MKQQRLRAYLGLIQELLTCPNGEEWIRLRQHEDLVDAGLVQTMEQVATTLAQEGRQRQAIFLHNWAGQLHHILAQPPRQEPEKNLSKAYADFITALLEATPEEQQNLMIANQHLITPGLVQMMRQVSAQLAAQGDIETSSYLNRLADELGKLWLQQHEFDQGPQEENPIDFESFPKRFKPEGMVNQTAKPLPSETPVPSQRPDLDQLSDLPDPWLMNEAEPATAASMEKSVPPQPPPTSIVPGPEAGFPDSTWQRVEAHLATIASALTQLSQHLSHAVTPANPLEHFEALEKAHQSGWVLTTEEVESLIHIHPRCSEEDTAFTRGSWRFIKVGKVGQQTGWKVEKIDVKSDVTRDDA